MCSIIYGQYILIVSLHEQTLLFIVTGTTMMMIEETLDETPDREVKRSRDDRISQIQTTFSEDGISFKLIGLGGEGLWVCQFCPLFQISSSVGSFEENIRQHITVGSSQNAHNHVYNRERQKGQALLSSWLNQPLPVMLTDFENRMMPISWKRDS